MNVPSPDFLIAIWTNVVLLFLLGGAILINIKFTGFSFYNIVYIFSFFWSFLILGTQYILDYPLDFGFLILMYSVPIIFNLVFLFVRLFLINRLTNIQLVQQQFQFDRVKWVTFLVFGLCILANLIYIYQEYFMKGIELVALEQVRSSTFQVEKEEPNLFYNLFGRIYLLLLPWFYFLYIHNHLKRITLIIIIIICILLSAVFLTRAPILMIFLYILFCNYYFLTEKLSQKLNSGLLLIAASIFMLITIVIESSDNALSSFFDSFKLYVFGGVGAFQNLVNGFKIADPFAGGYYYSFDFIYYIEKKIGLINSYPSYVRGYVDFGEYSTNVFTFLDSYYLDWGVKGVVFGSMVLFTITSIAYLFFLSSKKIEQFQVYILIFSNLMMCFMNNEFIRISFFISFAQIFLLKFIFSLRLKETV